MIPTQKKANWSYPIQVKVRKTKTPHKKNKTTDVLKIRIPIRKIKYEFWPYWIFYIPAYFYGLYLAIKSKSLTYFTATNPCMKYSGTFGYSKVDIMKGLPKEYLPKTIIVSKEMTRESFFKQVNLTSLSFPLIIKPEIGERGIGVELLHDEDSTWAHIELLLNHSRCLVQEFIDFDLEYGILYYRFPNQSKSGIISMAVKKFYTIVGDGVHTLEQIVSDDKRITHRRHYLRSKFGDKWKSIIPKGEKVVLENIGNHNRGTKFLNKEDLISNKVVNVLDNISKHLPDFYYGRFDLKIKSVESLQSGKDIKIIEINGVNSESIHIYDPDYSLIQAYKDVFTQMKLIYEISKQNREMGVSTVKWTNFLKALRHHFLSRATIVIKKIN